MQQEYCAHHNVPAFFMKNYKGKAVMNIILITKDVAEAITAISTAIIILISIVKLLPSPIKNFFTKIIPTFFCGFTDANGKKSFFFKAVKARNSQQEQLKDVLQSLTRNCKFEEFLVLNEKELANFLSETKLFTKISRRKQ